MKVFTTCMEASMEGIIGLKLEEERLYGIIQNIKIGQLEKLAVLVHRGVLSWAFQILHAQTILKMIGNILTTSADN